MTDEASDFGLDDLAGLEFVSRTIDVLFGAIVFALARVALQTTVPVIGHAAHAAALNAAPARCADRNCPALSRAAAASSGIG
jgi:hypothetical protein